LVDISENNLVEVVRDFRSSQVKLPDDFKTFAVALGSLEFDRMLRSEKDYDYVVNFSAMKHVRSERDPFSLMRMFHTNVYAVKSLLDHLVGTSTKKHFSVSSDKATNPANVMGATKIFMERVLLVYSDRIPFSTARFANVAFSDGSLLYGFLHRLAKKQPFSAPHDVKRYFISHEEAGQLCLLSCFLGENRDIYFPKLDEETDLLTFSDIAVIVLAANGYVPDLCSSEDEAKEKAARLRTGDGTWPCYFFGSDTTGEKSFEEFYTAKDPVDFSLYRSIGIISQPPWRDRDRIYQALAAFEKIRQAERWRKEDMVEAIRIIVPELSHEEKYKNLDQKM
jgi:FlaA1/EpsC-like NDP-sugar epimerase